MHVSLKYNGDRISSFPQYDWKKLARADARLLVSGSATRWVGMARLASTCWRLALGAQLRFLGALPLYGQSATVGTTAALWATVIATVHTAITMTYTATMSHTREPDFEKRPPYVHPGWRARARRDSVACDWHSNALNSTGATWPDMLATGAWRSAAGLWAQCRYVGRVQPSGPTAARWATITAAVYTANAMTSTITMNHTREPESKDKGNKFSRSRILAGESSRAQRLGCLGMVLPRVGLYWRE